MKSDYFDRRGRFSVVFYRGVVFFVFGVLSFGIRYGLFFGLGVNVAGGFRGFSFSIVFFVVRFRAFVIFLGCL